MGNATADAKGDCRCGWVIIPRLLRPGGDFTTIHPFRCAAIADGDSAQHQWRMDPFRPAAHPRDEIEKGESTPNQPPQARRRARWRFRRRPKKGPRYTPVSRRHECRAPSCGWCVTTLNEGRPVSPGRHHQDYHRQRFATAPP